MLAQRLLLGWISEGPEEVRGVARSLVESVLTALRLGGFWVHREQQLGEGWRRELSMGLAHLLADELLCSPYSGDLITIHNGDPHLTIRATRCWRQ